MVTGERARSQMEKGLYRPMWEQSDTGDDGCSGRLRCNGYQISLNSWTSMESNVECPSMTRTLREFQASLFQVKLNIYNIAGPIVST
jgi:hypothetical protein